MEMTNSCQSGIKLSSQLQESDIWEGSKTCDAERLVHTSLSSRTCSSDHNFGPVLTAIGHFYCFPCGREFTIEIVYS